ncbi:MAG: MoxR family ATPase [Ferruginibacter sp.]
MDTISYFGTALKERDNKLKLDVYNPSEELVEAVNLAMLLKHPLLLMGEPGCGKTRLAEAVAAELHGEKWQDHFFRWDIKSTSKAKDGIYQYDALKRMYDANAGNRNAKNVKNYISYGKFANALTLPRNGDIPNILLIDEIDKADIDFPNDLLLEIEKGEFLIPELNNKKVVRENPVIIFITSNRERELPPAFLRRCLYYYINFPKQEDLIKIINAKFNKEENDMMVKNAVLLFLDIRKKVETQFAENEKKPSTSELLEWFEVIEHCRSLDKEGKLDQNKKLLLDTIENYNLADFDNLKIPFQQVLLKTWESNQLFPAK